MSISKRFSFLVNFHNSKSLGTPTGLLFVAVYNVCSAIVSSLCDCDLPAVVLNWHCGLLRLAYYAPPPIGRRHNAAMTVVCVSVFLVGRLKQFDDLT